MATKFCPRCKEERLKEWFGDPNAPYAICLSCRVEVNGEEKTAKQENRRIRFSQNCAICEAVILDRNAELCEKCGRGIQCFGGSVKMLGRAASYQGRNLRGKKSKKFKRSKTKNRKLQALVKAQSDDARDNYIRFEHAIGGR